MISLGTHRLSVEVGERAADYRLFVPGGMAPDAAVPLVVALHRFSETGDTMAYITGFDAIAEREGFAVVYPDGPGRRFDFAGADRDDVALVLGVIDDVERRVPIDAGRVYLTGASNGGFMAFRLACAAPERFAAIAPVMSLMQGALDASAEIDTPVPIAIVYGTADTIIRPDTSRLGAMPVRTMSETIAYWRERNGAETIAERAVIDEDPGDGTRTQFTRFEAGRGGAPVVVYRVLGGGHTWPGGEEPSPRFLVGRVSRDFSASEAIWAFFTQHARGEVLRP